MEFARSRDWDLIRSIATHPKVYPHISDDFSPLAENWQPIKDDSIWYVIVRNGDELLGMFAFAPENAVCWKVHTCLLPNSYGKRAKQAATEVSQWIWENTPCLRINTDVPLYNVLALRFALDAGMLKFGVNPQSYMKFGKLHDQIELGMSKCL